MHLWWLEIVLDLHYICRKFDFSCRAMDVNCCFFCNLLLSPAVVYLWFHCHSRQSVVN